jgi:hypothetical protein
LNQVALDYSASKDGAALCVARDILSMGPRRQYVVFGQDVCASCYDCVHNVPKTAREGGNALVKMSREQLETELSGSFFGFQPNHGRVPHLRNSCEAWIEAKLQTYACTTSRDGETRYLPFRVKGSFMYNLFVQEQGNVASAETFRVAFNAVNKTWGKPRFKSECKSCRFCWTSFSKLHVLRSQKMVEEAAALEKEIAEHLLLQYLERGVYYGDRKDAFMEVVRLGGVRVECLIGDFTFPLPIPYLKQRTTIKDKLVKMLVGFGCLYDHTSARFGGGPKFYFNFFAGCKDDANTVCSMFYHYLTLKRNNGNLATGGLLNVQLDSASSNKCATAIGFFAWVAVKFGFQQVSVSYLIAGHTGEIADAVTAHLRNGFRSNGNVWSWESGFRERFESTYAKSELHPECYKFLDMAKAESWAPSAFNADLGHYLFDFDTFLRPICNRLSGFTDRNVHRTELSIHAWRFEVRADKNVNFSVRRLRSKSEEECPWSDVVPVFAQLPDLSLEPLPLYFGDPRHVISKEVDPNMVRVSLMDIDDVMPMIDKYGWQLLWQEVDQRLLRLAAATEKSVRCKVKRLPRVVALGEKPVVKWKPPRAALADDEGAPAPTPLVTVATIAGSRVEVRKPHVRKAANAGDEADLADEGDDKSSAEEQVDESDEEEDEDDNLDRVVVSVLGRKASERGIEFLVQFESSREGDGPIWTAERHLTDAKSQEAISKYKKEQLVLKKRIEKAGLKELNGAVSVQQQASRTRSGRK